LLAKYSRFVVVPMVTLTFLPLTDCVFSIQSCFVAIADKSESVVLIISRLRRKPSLHEYQLCKWRIAKHPCFFFTSAIDDIV